MNERAIISSLLLLVAFTSTTARGQGEADERVLRAVDDRERTAALNRDVPSLEALWSEEFTVNAPNNQVVAGRQRNLDTFVRGGIIDFSSFEQTIEFLRVDGNFGVIMGLETVIPRTDAPSVGLVAGQVIRRRFTNIWKKEGNTWRLYWRHANVITSR